MQKETILNEIDGLTTDQIADYIVGALDGAYDEGQEDAEEAQDEIDPEEDSAPVIAFALKELQEAKERGLSIDDLIRDLTIRSCRFM